MTVPCVLLPFNYDVSRLFFLHFFHALCTDDDAAFSLLLT